MLQSALFEDLASCFEEIIICNIILLVYVKNLTNVT